jgi:hypothetical protein
VDRAKKGQHEVCDATCRRLGAPWGGRPLLGGAARRTRGSRDAHGGVLFGILGSLRVFKGRPTLTGKEGMIGEVGTVRSPVGVRSEGWVFVHGELWRAVLAFAPEEIGPQEGEPMIGVGRKVSVVGFGEGGVVQVVPIGLPGRGRDFDRAG